MRDFDKEASDNLGRNYNYEFDVILRRFILEDIKHYLNGKSDALTLEIGSYDGSMTEIILDYVKSLTVVEPAESLTEILEKKFSSKVSIVNSTIEDYTTEILYDNIFLVHTLEHIEKPINALQKISKLLKHDGKLIIAVPNAEAASRQIAVKMGLISHNEAVLPSEAEQGHFRTYTFDTLQQDLHESGLKILLLTGIVFKGLANFQIDGCLKHGIIGIDYLKAANELAKIYPRLSSSILAVCTL